MQLKHALRLTSAPCLAFVGSGGKTTALFRLARELNSPVVLTATTHMAASQRSLADHHIAAATPADLLTLNDAKPTGVLLVTGPQEGERSQGVARDVLDWLHAYCEEHALPLFVEADGSRQRPLKAPEEHEPPIPPFVETVVVVAGLSALGQPLEDRFVHRPEIYTRLSGLTQGQSISSEALARVLTHPEGGLKNIPLGARRVSLLNQADTPELQAQGRAVADLLLPAYEAVVITSLQQRTIHAVLEPVAGIVLAAGESRRFGQPKQLLEYHGQTFVRVVARTALTAGLSPVLVVTGSNADAVESAVRDLPVKIVRNEAWSDGQSSSIRAGLNALSPSPPHTEERHRSVGAAIFLLVDQPQVQTTVLRALLERHANGLFPIVAPLVQERRANPVLFDRITFSDLMALSGDTGGRAIFSKYPPTYLPWHDGRLLLDVDMPEDFEKLNRQD
jgi:molybdenum cofactor cytidylyltransferase